MINYAIFSLQTTEYLVNISGWQTDMTQNNSFYINKNKSLIWEGKLCRLWILAGGKNASHFFNYFQMNETIQKRFWKDEKITFVYFQCDVETATGVYSCLSVDMMFKRQVCSTTTIPPLLCCLDHTYHFFYVAIISNQEVHCLVLNFILNLLFFCLK